MCKQLILSMMLVISIGLSAQTTYNKDDYNGTGASESRMSFGLKIGPSIAWMAVNSNDMQPDGATMKMGIGGVFEYKLLPNMSLVTGLNYNSFGGYAYDSISLNDTLFSSNFKINYGEIEVPIAVKLKTTAVNKTSYFLQAGISAGFKTSASEKRIPVADKAKPVYNDITLLTNSARLTCLLGVGVEHSVGKRTTLFGLVSYKNSLTNLANSPEYLINRYTSSIQIYPGNVDFSVGIMF